MTRCGSARYHLLWPCTRTSFFGSTISLLTILAASNRSFNPKTWRFFPSLALFKLKSGFQSLDGSSIGRASISSWFQIWVVFSTLRMKNNPFLCLTLVLNWWIVYTVSTNWLSNHAFFVEIWKRRWICWDSLSLSRSNRSKMSILGLPIMESNWRISVEQINCDDYVHSITISYKQSYFSQTNEDNCMAVIIFDYLCLLLAFSVQLTVHSHLVLDSLNNWYCLCYILFNPIQTVIFCKRR